jgi:hypothetical protein
MRLGFAVVGLLIVLCGSFGTATGEPPDSTRVHSDAAGAARTKPKGALLTEVGIHTALAKPEGVVDATYSTIDLGYLARTGSRTLVGGDVSFTFHDDGSFWAIEPRVRRELDRNWCVDVAAGPIISATAQSHNLDGPGISAYTMIHYRGFIGVTLGVQSLDYSPAGAWFGTSGEGEYSGRVTSTYVGVRVGKGPGIVGAAVLGILGLAALASLSN